MARKYLYKIYCEGIKEGKDPIVYNYSRTKGIRMTITKDGFFFSFEQTVKKDLHNLLKDNLVRDAMKKAALIQLIKHGAIVQKKIFVESNDERLLAYDSNEKGQLIYGLCGNKLKYKMSKEWNQACFETIASSNKSKSDRLDASLYALLMSKSKEYALERFIYLWMSMNGLYGYIAAEARKVAESKKVINWVKKEVGQLKLLSLVYGYSYRGAQEDNKNSIVLQMELILDSISLSEINDFLIALKKNDLSFEQVRKINELMEKYELNTCPYAACLILCSYLIRCKYFHSENALPLLCFEEEHPIPAIRVLNRVLEDFLDNELYKWFNKSLLETQLLPRVDLVANHCELNSKGLLKSCVIDGIDYR